MTLYDRRKKKLIEDLKDKEYRDAFVEAGINVGIPFQIKAIRDQRKWTQKDLENASGMKQTRISLMEDQNYSSFSIKTLKKLASAFDVGLLVRFVPFSELAERELNLSSESLQVLSFEQETYFKEESSEEGNKNIEIIEPVAKASGKVVLIKDYLEKQLIDSMPSHSYFNDVAVQAK